MSDFSRRKFLKTGAAALAGITIAPSSILGMSHGHVSPTDKLNLAAVGIGGMGHANINNVKGTENIVALCDVDWKYAKGVFDEFPNAKKYWDYRKMYDEMGKSIDGVIIATADHTHAIITADAMTMGKHVYCQKPLTHSVYESRLLTKLAASTGVVTQMGNQGASGEGTDLVCEWIWNGEIGEVTKVECATDRPIWPQGLNAPEKADRIPNTLNWDLFTGPAKLNPYNNVYHPWNWRGWWDYGTGALGDMACHILHQPFRALKLGYPTKVEGSSTLLLSACAPQADEFPNAKKYWDYRKMYDEMGKSIDGVIIATADHTHAIITADAMTMGKHVYCQKPLTHSVYESRLLTNLAASTGVVTQMGNQGASGEGTDLVCEWIWNGEIGEVTKVECATDRPIWPQGLNAPEKADRIPNTLNWDLFTGPAKLNPYNNVYHPWNWRGWWDYGTGALGDMACHILHQPFRALKLGASTGVVTQMGNQGASGEGTDLVCEWIWNGEIGEVTKVECATDRPIWPQGLNAPEKADRIPNTLNWDLFTGPAKLNPYNNVYHPWNWRGWWDYGTGALGDMACHILHQPFRALKLGYPTKVEGSSTLLLSACAPQAQHVKMIFPARDNMPKVALPEVEVHWYDGGMMPERPKGFPEGKQLMGPGGGLTIFHGTKDTLICGCYGEQPFLLSGRVPNAPKVCRRVTCSHEMDWVHACKEDKSNRVMPKADFSESGPMNEMVVMGVLAIRLQG
ncbi:Gfo/Idh/MocA family oxidoreductase, partial [Bacteroides thetaiotaomicron]